MKSKTKEHVINYIYYQLNYRIEPMKSQLEEKLSRIKYEVRGKLSKSDLIKTMENIADTLETRALFSTAYLIREYYHITPPQQKIIKGKKIRKRMV